MKSSRVLRAVLVGVGRVHVPSFAPTLLPSAASVENLWLLNRSSGLQRMMFLPLEDRLPGDVGPRFDSYEAACHVTHQPRERSCALKTHLQRADTAPSTARGVRVRDEPSPNRRRAHSSSLIQRGASPSYSRSCVTRSVPAHGKMRRSAPATATATRTASQTPTTVRRLLIWT